MALRSTIPKLELKIGTYGTSTEIRVINADALATAITEFANYTGAVERNPTATNAYLESTLSTTGSVEFSSYFATVEDVTDDAELKTYSAYGNCYDAAKARKCHAKIET
jgi:hypothetical protein